MVNPWAGEGSEATVFLFVRTDCPISNRYAPEVQRLTDEFAPRGVRFWLVYPGMDEPAEAIRRHLEDYGYPLAALRDPRHELVDLTGAQATPEAAVFAEDGELVYSGRIDNWYVSFGKARPEPTEHDLRQALEATLAGRPYEPRRTRAIGCTIPPLQ